jgi:hypothetical protein
MQGYGENMKLWGKRKTIELSNQPHSLDAPGFWVNWISYCQPQLEQVAQQIGWQPGAEPSPALVATLTPDPQAPRNAEGLRVEVGGIRIGYSPRADYGQSAGVTAVVLVKTGRDIRAYVAA